jgi:hypothetical protein
MYTEEQFNEVIRLLREAEEILKASNDESESKQVEQGCSL